MHYAIRKIAILGLALAAWCAADVGAQAEASAPAKSPAKSSAAQKPAKHDGAAVPAAKQSTLDVAALKERLRETKALGFFTKLELQNQVNDLLARFRAHYDNGKDASVADLRQPYDMLVLKVLALLQDSDPALAQTILESREAIWKILADPVKFKSLS